MYLCLVSFVDTPERLRKFHLWIVVVSLLLAIQGIHKKGRVGSYFLGDENDFCLAMNVLLPFSYFALLEKDSPKRKILYITTMIVCIGAIVNSFSRGGFVGLLAVGAYCWWKSPKKIVGALTVVVLAGALFFFAGDRYWSEMGTITDEQDSTRQGRIDSWKAAMRIFADHPLGVGAGGYPYTVGNYDYELQAVDRTLAGRAAHSLYFTLLPELGIPGTFFYLGLVLAALRLSRKAGKAVKGARDRHSATVRVMALATMAGMVGYLVSGAFISVLYYPHVFYLAAFSALVWRQSKIIQAESEEEAGEEKPEAPMFYRYGGVR
jgi:probable O-glycosylation ligase (exosortase A-associated)